MTARLFMQGAYFHWPLVVLVFRHLRDCFDTFTDVTDAWIETLSRDVVNKTTNVSDWLISLTVDLVAQVGTST